MTASNWRDPAPGATGKRATADYTLRGSIYTGAVTAWLPVAGFLLGLIGAGLALYLDGPGGWDARIWWQASRLVLRGENPYPVTYGYYPLFYPMPALLVVAPLAWLPWRVFFVVTAGLGGLALGYAASQRPALGPALLSAGFFASAAGAAWEPVLLAGVAVPWIAALTWPAKPSLGLALFAAYPRKVAVAGGLILGLLSLALVPTWPVDWLTNLRETNHVPPILRPFGWLPLLAWVRWRDPGARLIGTLAVVPHTVSIGSALLLFAVCRTKWEGYALAVLSFVGAFWRATRIDPGMGLVEQIAAGWLPVLVCCYLPALYLVLRR